MLNEFLKHFLLGLFHKNSWNLFKNFVQDLHFKKSSIIYFKTYPRYVQISSMVPGEINRPEDFSKIYLEKFLKICSIISWRISFENPAWIPSEILSRILLKNLWRITSEMPAVILKKTFQGIFNKSFQRLKIFQKSLPWFLEKISIEYLISHSKDSFKNFSWNFFINSSSILC